MRRVLAAVAALLTLAGCASSGPQQASDVAFAHKDPKPARLAVNTEAVAADANCYGDGQSGRRVQAVYVAEGNDRYASLVGTIRTYAARVDGVYNDSAAQTGGTAHVRWACVDGVVDVLHVTAPVGADIEASRNAVSAAVGGLRSDRKYLVWEDASRYCGISYVAPNDTPDPATNPANNSAGFGRIDTGCWGGMTESHELAHGLGAVQNSAPHSTGAWHCNDEYDRMCYSDGGPSSTMRYVCPSSGEAILDCNHDDYFRAAPPVPGSYLASHWNIADSGFLEVVKGSGSTPSPTPTTPSPSPTATATPTPTPTPTVTPSPTPTPTKAPKPCGHSKRPGCR